MQKGYHTCLPHGNSRTARVIIACRDAGGEVDLIMLAHIRRRHAVDGRLDPLAIPVVLVGLTILPVTRAVGGGLTEVPAAAKAQKRASTSGRPRKAAASRATLESDLSADSGNGAARQDHSPRLLL
jgi:protein-disulfide isomerase-like protein with CxxC motif